MIKPIPHLIFKHLKDNNISIKLLPSPGYNPICVPKHDSFCLTSTKGIYLHDRIKQNELTTLFKFSHEEINSPSSPNTYPNFDED